MLTKCGAFSIRKKKIVKRLKEHIEFLEDPGIDARYKGLLDL